MSLGLRRLGYDIAAAYDNWEAAVGIYNHNSKENVAQVCDLTRPCTTRFFQDERKRVGAIDLLVAGAPCKGFSQIRNGHHTGGSAHNRVLYSLPRHIAVLRPRVFLLENVPDLARHAGGRTLTRVLNQLRSPGRRLQYRIQQAVCDAALFGVPQARRRFFILGVREGPEALPGSSPDLAQLYAAIRHGGQVPLLLAEYLQSLREPDDLRCTSAQQALSDLPALTAGAPEKLRKYRSPPKTAFQRLMREGGKRTVTNTQTPNVREETVQRLSLIPAGGSADDIPPELKNGLSRRFGSAYRRLHPLAPATALSTKYDCVYHFSEHRSLSVREYARLQGVPDWFEFPADVACRRHAYEMIGNSVPPLLVQGVVAAASE